MNRRFLSGSWLALVLACGGSSSTAPGAPDHVTATAGDAVVQVEWSAVAGAKSYTVYYDTAVSKGSPKVTTDATGAEIHGLTNGVAYQFAVTASNSSGESALSAIATATPQAPPPALTATVAPADGATSVSRNPQVQVVFGRAVDASTVSAITSGTDCGTSTVQLSADDFATCIAFASRAATAGDTTFTFTLGAPLAGSATYKLRLAIGIKDPAGVGLAHSTTATFTTAAALAVSATAPSGVDVAPLPSLSVTFNRAADASSVTVQTGAGACQGSLQLSSDGFTNCVALAAQPSTSDNRVFVVTPAAELALGTPYTLRVKASVRDSDGLALGADFDGAPFTTLAAFTLLGATPGDGDTGVPLRGPIVLRFNRAAMLSTVTTGAGCTGSVRIASGGLCEQGAVTANATGEVVTITPPPDLDALSPDAQYTLSVTAGVTDAAGHALSNPLAQATGFHTRLPTTLAISPADGAGPVPINTPIVLAFSRPVTGLTTNPTSSCTGASVVVTTGFAGACVPIDHVTVSGGTYTLHPAGYLPANKTLNVSIAGGAILDAVDGVHYQGDTSEAHGFTTGDVLSIDFTEPGDADTALARNTPISLFFNRAPLLSTLTTNTDTACDKAVQLSTDPDFGANTCVPMAAALPDNPAGTTEYDFKPKDPLSGSTTFYLRVVAGMVADDAGVSIARDLIMTTGFSTSAEMTVDATLTTHGTGLTPDVQPVVVFTRAPDPATIDGDCGTGSLFLEAPGGSCVAASVEKVDDLTWQILPAATLPGDQDYTIVVTTAVKDSDGVPLASEFRQSFHVRPALQVIDITPGDGATGQPLTLGAIVLKFNRDVGTEGFDSNVSCTGTLEISSDGFSTCIALAQAPSVGDTPDTVKLVPAAPLLPHTRYFIRARKSFTDVDGFGMDADYLGAGGFLTKDAVSIASVTPADGATGVAPGATISLTFSRAIDAGTLTAAGTNCTGGTLLLTSDAFAHCLPIAGVAPSTGSATTVVVTPAALLPSSSLIRARVTASAHDADGAPLSGDLTTAGFHIAALAAVGGLAIESLRLQSMSLTWSDSDPAFDHANVYVSLAGAGEYVLMSSAGTAQGGSIAGLTPFSTWDVRVRAADAYGHESAPADLTGVETTFTGDPADFVAGQALAGWNGDLYRLTWTQDSLLAGVSKSDGTSLLNDGDELWIAIDTDNPAVGDVNGETRTATVGNNEVIWPFKADHVMALTQVDAAHTSVAVHDAGASGFNTVTTDSYSGAVDEMRVPAASLGSPQHARFAFAVVQAIDGLVRSIAPVNSNATDVLGYFGSLTAMANTGTNVFLPAAVATSMSPSTSPLAQAVWLVTLSVDSPAAVTRIDGSLHPLSYQAGDVSYTLSHPSGTLYGGKFNFGASTQELFFKFVQGASAEFAGGTDRVYTLAGTAESLPLLTYGTPLGAPCQLTFVVAPAGGVTPDEVRGDTSPLSWTSGQPLSTPLDFAACDFTSTHLEFKAYDSGGLTWEDGPNQAMNDDVLNKRTLTWTFNTHPTF